MFLILLQLYRLSPPSPGGAGRRGAPANQTPANAASRAPPPPPATGRPAPAIPNRPGPEQGRQPPAPPGRPGSQQGLPPPLIPS